MGIKFDPILMEAKKINNRFLKTQLIKLCRDYIAIISLMSLLKPQQYALFDVEISADSMDHTLSQILGWRHLLNNFLVACT